MKEEAIDTCVNVCLMSRSHSTHNRSFWCWALAGNFNALIPHYRQKKLTTTNRKIQNKTRKHSL